MLNNKNSLIGIMPLFLVIAIDSMGLGILFPILSSMLMDPHSHFLSASVGMFHRELLYGVVIGIFMIAWFFGSAILGDLSDTIGRKKSLIICLVGAMFGYIFSGFAMEMHSITMLIIGRLIAGFTAGSQPIAQAAIVDISTEENKARNIGFILLTVSIGFVLGPLIGGFLSDARFGSWFNYATPMYFAAAISFINIILLKILFKETFSITGKVKIRLHHAIQIFIEAFQSKRIRMLSIGLLIFISAWSGYFTFIAMYLIRRYHYSSLQTSLFMACMSVGFSVGFAILVNYLANRYPLKKVILINMILTAILTFLTLIAPYQFIVWILGVFIGMTVSTAYSMFITLFSNQVSPKEQGWVMGITNSIMALSFGVTTFLSGMAVSLSASAPLIFTVVGMLLAAILMKFTRV